MTRLHDALARISTIYKYPILPCNISHFSTIKYSVKKSFYAIVNACLYKKAGKQLAYSNIIPFWREDRPLRFRLIFSNHEAVPFLPAIGLTAASEVSLTALSSLCKCRGKGGGSTGTASRTSNSSLEYFLMQRGSWQSKLEILRRLLHPWASTLSFEIGDDFTSIVGPDRQWQTVYELKGTQEWEIFCLRFWIFYYFYVSYA